MIEGIVASVLASLLLIAGGYAMRHRLGHWLRTVSTMALTHRTIKGIHDYSAALRTIRCQLGAQPQGEHRELAIMCFMGKDLSLEHGLLRDICGFLHNGGNARILLTAPDSDHVTRRASTLHRDPANLRANIERSIGNIIEDIHAHFPSQVCVRVYDAVPLVRLVSVHTTVFLGFYGDAKSYDSLVYEIDGHSPLGDAMMALFESRWKSARSV